MIYVLIIIVIIIFVLYKILVILNNKLLLLPTKIANDNDDEYYKSMETLYNLRIKNKMIDSTDNCKIHLNYLKKISNNSNKLFIFAHGNAGNILNRIESPSIQFLLNYGSVILFDYRGYGCSSGDPSEDGLKDDILAIWNYSINVLKYNPDDIILYGESLGCSCVAWLGSYLLNIGKPMPLCIIMQSGFYSLEQIVSDLFHPLLTYLVFLDFDNNEYIKNIKIKKPNYPLIILHSKDDEMINFDHSYKLATENDCILQEIHGKHNLPIFNERVKNLFNRIIKKLNLI